MDDTSTIIIPKDPNGISRPLSQRMLNYVAGLDSEIRATIMSAEQTKYKMIGLACWKHIDYLCHYFGYSVIYEY